MSNERTGVLELTLGDSYIGSAYSPQVEVTDTDTGHEVAITYMSPSGLVTERFDVEDGEQGPQGPAGYSPTVTITDTPTGHTVTITDAQGPHSYDVPNYAQEEQQRQDAWGTLSGEVADAISDAETATSAATTAAQSATSAATSATTAAQAATTAAASANTAASSANAAATAANSAATAAGTAADSATTAASSATDAAQAANTAAEAAQEAATEVAPEVAWLWGNQLTGELAGDLLTAADAYAAPPMALTVDGRSTQASTTGKNLFDKDNAPLGYYGSDGAFHSSGSGSSGYRWWSVPVSEGDVIRWADSTNNYLTGWSGGTFVQLAATRPTSPFTVPSGVDEVRGYTQNSTLDTCIVTKNDADLTYEPYTGGKPSPSPDYPQPIESVDALALAFAGKNLATLDALKPYVTESDGVYTGTATNFYTSHHAFTAGGVKANLTTISFDAYTDANVGTNGNGLAVSLIREDGSTITWPISVPNSTTSWTHFEKTISLDAYGIMLGFSANGGNVWHVRNFCIRNDGETSYEPYTGHTVPIDLQDHVLRSLPDDTKDTLALTYLRPSTREGWAWYTRELVQRVDNSGDISSGASYVQRNNADTCTNVQITISEHNWPNAGSALSTQYKVTSLVWRQLNAGEIHLTASGVFIGVDATFANSAAANAWLAEHPFTFDYPLATPVTHDLGEIELPVLPAPNCTVWADPTTGLTMEYVQDTNIVIASLQAALADLATS